MAGCPGSCLVPVRLTPSTECLSFQLFRTDGASLPHGRAEQGPCEEQLPPSCPTLVRRWQWVWNSQNLSRVHLLKFAPEQVT